MHVAVGWVHEAVTFVKWRSSRAVGPPAVTSQPAQLELNWDGSWLPQATPAPATAMVVSASATARPIRRRRAGTRGVASDDIG